MKKTILATVVTGTVLAGAAVAMAVPAPKYFVCKYVGTPGVNESLQTGQNPISVSGNALDQPVVIGAYFNDAQGRSYVVAEDEGQPEPSCVPGQSPPKEQPQTPGNVLGQTNTPTEIPAAPVPFGGK